MKNLSIEELRRLEARTIGAYKRSKRAEAKQRNVEKLREIHGALQAHGEAPLYSLSTSEFKNRWQQEKVERSVGVAKEVKVPPPSKEGVEVPRGPIKILNTRNPDKISYQLVNPDGSGRIETNPINGNHIGGGTMTALSASNLREYTPSATPPTPISRNVSVAEDGGIVPGEGGIQPEGEGIGGDTIDIPVRIESVGEPVQSEARPGWKEYKALKVEATPKIYKLYTDKNGIMWSVQLPQDKDGNIIPPTAGWPEKVRLHELEGERRKTEVPINVLRTSKDWIPIIPTRKVREAPPSSLGRGSGERSRPPTSSETKGKDYRWVIEKQVKDLSAAERSDFLKHYQDYVVLVKDPQSGELKPQREVIAQVEAAAKLLGFPLEKALDKFLDTHPEIVLRIVHVDVERALRFRHEELLEDPEQARETLLAVRTDIELAEFFGLTKRYLYYLTYGNKERYTSFGIPKKRGGTRKIDAPIPELKNVQRLLLDVLLNPAEMEDCVYGFRVGRSIVDNAKPHGGSAFVLNIDIKDFFPTIHFGRVKGFFHYRFGFPEEVAVLLAQLTTHKQVLPQGAPTSPAIANLVCQKLDKRLAAWAEKEEFRYTRYADDMTFSSNDGKLLTQTPFILKIINDEGFDINPKKLRVMRRGGRQEVTGLVVNQKRPAIPRERLRWLRAVIHNCQRYGVVSQAQKAMGKGLLKSKKGKDHGGVVDFKNFLYGHAFYVYMVRPDLGAKMLADLRKLDWPKKNVRFRETKKIIKEVPSFQDGTSPPASKLTVNTESQPFSPFEQLRGKQWDEPGPFERLRQKRWE